MAGETLIGPLDVLRDRAESHIAEIDVSRGGY